MGAAVWRDDEGRLRCRRSPGGTAWYARVRPGGGFGLTERGDEPEAGEVTVGRIDPETAESLIKFLLRERQERLAEANAADPPGADPEPATDRAPDSRSETPED